MDYIKEKINDFFKYRFLLYNLISREIKVKYRRSILGILWSVLNPLFTMIVISMVFSRIFRFNVENFNVYFLTGSVIFSFMSDATTLYIIHYRFRCFDKKSLYAKIYFSSGKNYFCACKLRLFPHSRTYRYLIF